MTDVTRTPDGGSLRAIETRYAGCLFRSRLEARWAVFFDTLGIAWEYEAQGFECQPRCWLSGVAPFWYLPDFWLPDLGLHAEVKGSLTEQEARRLLDAAAYLSAPLNGCGDGHDLIVLGPVPRGLTPQPAAQAGNRAPWLLHMHKGVLTGTPWLPGFPLNPCLGLGAPLVLATDGDESINDVLAYAQAVALSRVPELLLRGAAVSDDNALPLWRSCTASLWRGYAAARSARFEHGESGAPVRAARQQLHAGLTGAARLAEYETWLRERYPR